MHDTQFNYGYVVFIQYIHNDERLIMAYEIDLHACLVIIGIINPDLLGYIRLFELFSIHNGIVIVNVAQLYHRLHECYLAHLLKA